MEFIKIRGARTHNLKNIHLILPRNKLIVITGLSGSGKSSLAFDTLYAEGQRRYVESLSAYARQFLQLMEKPSAQSRKSTIIYAYCLPALAILIVQNITLCCRHKAFRKWWIMFYNCLKKHV